MLTYSFENRGKESLYTWLYRCMKDDILSGKLVSGEKLPSKRSFARQLGVSTLTVENAYALLQTEGYVSSLPKKGYYVADIPPAFHRSQPGAVSAPDSVAVSFEQPEEQQFFADFSSNQTRKENFPFSVWTKLIRRVMTEQGENLLKNSPGGGILPLREAIAEQLREFRDMQVSPEQIIVGAGTEYLYGLLIQLLGLDSVYAVENPGYQKIWKIYQAHGVACRYIDLDRSGMQPELLKVSGANVIHISPSHHFPTGITMPISRRHELLAWASEEEERYIIEDDYDSEFRLSGKPVPTLQSIDQNGRVIYINTFTKSLASTIRISYMVLPASLLARYRERLDFYSCTVSNFEQYTLAAFIREGHYEKHINRMRNNCRKKRNLLLDAIARSPLSALVSISEEDAGLHFLMHVRTNLTDEELMSRAAEKGIRLTGLSYYFRGGEGQSRSAHTFVVNYSNIDENRIEEAVERLYQALHFSVDEAALSC